MTFGFLKNIFYKKSKIIKEKPLRDVLLSMDQLKLHAKSLARKHKVSFKKGKEKLLKKLKENQEVLLEASEIFNKAGKAKRKISPAADWLLDNFYLIEEQIRLARKYLPKGYSKELPNLTQGPFAGYPRVYDLAFEAISHGDGKLDIKVLTNFISEYQTIKYLKLGELWAIPIMLRLALIENLRRVSSRMVVNQLDRDKADYWANKIIEIQEKDVDKVISIIAEMEKEDIPTSSSFVAEFVRKLYGKSSTHNLAISWLEKKLAKQDKSIDRMVQSTSRKQAADQVSIANTIESLRLLESTDWRDFVEELSLVDKILRQDPSGDYPHMSFITRDQYRHVIEKLAKRTKIIEHEVAKKALELATEAEVKNTKEHITAHIGYYLKDKGLSSFCRLLNTKIKLDEYIQTKQSKIPLVFYLGSIVVLTSLSMLTIIPLIKILGIESNIWLTIFGILLFFTTSQVSVSLVNFLVTIIIKPKKIPRMDFSEGIPKHLHTLVVVPTIINSIEGIDELVEKLEIRYLANVDANVDFALLTDFCDAKEERLPKDEKLLNYTKESIEKLNDKYKKYKENVFYLFHRPRKWNESEKIWMAYERKRGKLAALNSLLRGTGKENFSFILGNIDLLQDVKYVITLDSDTLMPREVARELVAVIAHPLNKPIYDETKKRVVSGHGILQPRVDVSYPGDNPSLFVKIFGGEVGIDPYTKAVSDVYQDLFNEGSFIGKGLYEVDTFEKALKDRFPENLILSHDLLEGCYLRSALVTDVQLYEEYPSTYLQDVSRRTRWIRGDWQIYKWLFSKVLNIKNEKEKNPLSTLSKWKVFDNLRRSFFPLANILIFVIGTFFFYHPWFWSLLLLSFVGIPVFFISSVDFIRKSKTTTLKAHINTIIYSYTIRILQFCCSITFMVYEAYFSLNSITKALWRMFFSHTKMLEWRASSEYNPNQINSIISCYKEMYFSPLFSLSFIGFIILTNKPLDMLTIAILSLWALGPSVVYVLGFTPAIKKVDFSKSQILFLSKMSRRIWAFFETFVTEDDNWLPPDNFQETHGKSLAHRTSPTNIGLYLLSNLSAYDFGYISMGHMLKRTENTINTINNMEKHKGHLYNWYDTKTLIPLEPLYVSSVDSGNLVGHLLVLKAGLLELINHKIITPKIFDGLNDTLNIIEEHIKESDLASLDKETIQKIEKTIISIKNKTDIKPAYLSEIYIQLRQISNDISKILTYLSEENFTKIKKWLKAFEHQCYDYIEDISYIAPWTSIIEIPNLWESTDSNQKKQLNKLQKIIQGLDANLTLDEILKLEISLIPEIDRVIENTAEKNKKEKEWFVSLKTAIQDAVTRASDRINTIDYIALRCAELSDIEHEFLYDKQKNLFSIGYNIREHKTDSSYYDLLASEARLTSFVAIATGKVPQEHWFMLGRMISRYSGAPVLLSWGGSMFEYLMPLLVMPTYNGTLLDKTYKTSVLSQIKYGNSNNVPWGISESAYNKIDASMSYQYQSFGVPYIGFKRGLSEDLVISPYSSLLALMIEPKKAYSNLEKINSIGGVGDYGFYEAIDYTATRLAHDENYEIVKSYMAHHQGMSLLSLAYILLDKPMQKRFLSDPMFKATELLLQEKVPKESSLRSEIEVTGLLKKLEERETLLRVFPDPSTDIPEIHMLSNGRYNVMLTNTGAGFSKWKNIMLNRWHEDTTMDNEGSFVYLRDVETGKFWSNSYQPTLKKHKIYEAIFSQSRVEFKRRDYGIETHTKIAVSPEDDIELRRLIITNRNSYKKIIEITSYSEVVLNTPESDLAHRAFSNLFVKTEIIMSHQAIIFHRRPRTDSEKYPLMIHLMAVHGKTLVGASYETDRSKFIGRGNTLANPYGVNNNLSDSEGSVLDPVASIRTKIVLEPDESATIDYVTGICDNHESARLLMEKYRDKNLADRVFDLAWTHGQIVLDQMNATESDAQIYGRLASAIVYTKPEWRANSLILKQNYRGQSDLWGHGISGDLPIVIVKIRSQENIDLVERMIQAHYYWQMKGLEVDLIIWNEDPSVYRDLLGEIITSLIHANFEKKKKYKGTIYLKRSDQMSEEDRVLLQSVAKIIVSDRYGTLNRQVDKIMSTKSSHLETFIPSRTFKYINRNNEKFKTNDLLFFNGFGGFSKDGSEYLIFTSKDKRTPLPWANVLANKNFGTVISESGSAYTWSENAHGFRLTPWRNEVVSDVSGEAFYIRDDETGNFWSPTPLPAGKSEYITTHGFGYTTFKNTEDGIETELTIFVALEKNIKFSIFKIKNNFTRPRTLSIYSYNELVMGTFREKNHMHIKTDLETNTNSLLAYNYYNKEFPNRTAFLSTTEEDLSFTTSRKEFIGRNNNLDNPSSMRMNKLSGNIGAGLDPCFAMQVKIEIKPNSEEEVFFSFGSGKDTNEAKDLISSFKEKKTIREELEKVKTFWKKILGKLTIKTPDDSINFLTNGWLQYQNISSRLWGRTGFYQSGGAYGFRDQLQDVMSLVYIKPELIKEHILTFAKRQFIEGDVQHWWHPSTGRGIRSHCSDDYLWLPLVTALYVEEVGDRSILDEKIPFLEGPSVKNDEESYYGLPEVSNTIGTLYEHCILSIKRALRYGEHGLPLIGSGDWNDGMNLIGKDGKGESVWLGFFLSYILKSMSKISKELNDNEFYNLCIDELKKLELSIEKVWDGDWYQRAFFDNGEVLGSSTNKECKIDSLPQSWAVISDTGRIERKKKAMESVDKLLVDRENSLIKLFNPPFDHMSNNPGYIKGYVPGVRENGGQYTHAAVWSIIAFALLKDKEKTYELIKLINPINHSLDEKASNTYKVEPYVMAADIYTADSHIGRGGWTWYTGSASWMYQLLIKYVIGLKLAQDKLYLDPCMPKEWKDLSVSYQHKETFFDIKIKNIGKTENILITVDGIKQKENYIKLNNDKKKHKVDIVLG